MTFEEYIMNPMGKKNAVLNAATRELMKKSYTHKFDNIMIREKGYVEYYLFHDKKKNVYWAYIKIPSEVCRKFYYDVVLRFSADEHVKGGGNDLLKYNIQFYSNDPAFVYTYAYVFNKNKLFIKELHNKMVPEALKMKPVEKNANQAVGYVKSLYFAYLLIMNRGLNKRIKFEAEALNYDDHFLYYISKIMPAEQKIEERQREGKKYSSKKKIDLDDSTYRRVKKIAGKDADMSRVRIRTTKSIGKIKNSSKVKNTSTVNRK